MHICMHMCVYTYIHVCIYIQATWGNMVRLKQFFELGEIYREFFSTLFIVVIIVIREMKCF